MFPRSIFVRLGSLWLVAAFVIGCAGDGGQNAIINPNQPTVTAINVSPDSAGITFRAADTVLSSGLTYLQKSDLVTLEDPDYDITIRSDSSGVDVDDQVLSPIDGRDYLLVALGLTTYGAETLKRLRLSILDYDRTIPNGNKARLIVLNAFNRKEGFEPTSIDFQDGDVPQFQLRGIAFGDRQTIVVDAGTIAFEARQADSELVYAAKTATFESGKIYLALITGVEDQTGAKIPQIAYIPLPTRNL